MRASEPGSRSPSARSGRFAPLANLLPANGTGAPSSRPRARARTASLALLAAALLAAAPASALVTRELESQITGTCATPGSCPAAERIPFAEPEGLTVDSSARPWVTDRPNHAVDRFGAAGAFEAQSTGAGAWESSPVRSLAFSAAAAEVFVADPAHCAVWGLEAATAAPSGKQLTPSSCPSRVAADNSAGATGGDLYLISAGTLQRIKASDGSPDDFTAGPGSGTDQISGLLFESDAIAVAPNGDFYWGGETSGSHEYLVDQFAPSGELVREITDAGGHHISFPTALAVDPSSEHFLLSDAEAHLFEFAPNGAFLRQIEKPGGAAFEGIGGLAAGSSGRLYVSEGTPSAKSTQIDVFSPLLTLPDVAVGPAEVHSTTAATLHGEVDPAGPQLTECRFEYGETTAYGQTAPCEPPAASIPADEAEHPVEAQLTELTPGVAYHYRLLAANANGFPSRSPDRSFVTGPTIDSTSALAVSAASATLEAEVNPHANATAIHFEYVSQESFAAHGFAEAVSTPSQPIGSGEADVARSALIQGLAPATTYHYRAVATSALGEVLGPDQTFTTQPASFPSGLPDSRGYELVSPPDKHGVPLAPIGNEGGGLIQAAADGSAITYYTKGSIVSDPAGDRSFQNSQDLSTRAATGWSTLDITTPHRAPTGVEAGNASEYKLFSAGLSLGAVEPIGATPLSSQATERTPYLRLPDGSYEPLVTEANVPPGTHFGGKEDGHEGFEGAVHFITATPDLSHLLLESPTSLVEGFKANKAENIYEWSAGALAPVNYVPSGSAARCGGAGPACVASERAEVGFRSWQVRNAISTDGSRVVFSGGAQLFLRDLPRGETLRLDLAQGLPEPEHPEAQFQDASADGRRIFFTDPGRLTPGSTASPNKPDLYMCEVEVKEEHLACALTDLSVDPNPGESANVKGDVIGASADGSSVYFVANGALTAGEGAVRGTCGEGAGDSCNLYRFDTETSSLRLVAVLSGADFPDWRATGGANLRELTARVSPDGRFLAFMSERPLTGYDNRDAVSGARDEEVFLYDARAEGGKGKLICASCNPTGARPAGRQGPPNVPAALVDGSRNWGGRWYAANLPGWTTTDLSHALYQSRYLSDSGRLFFNSSDALVPSDTNGTEDVYQYEPPSTAAEAPPNDTCTTSDPNYSPVSGGCLSLISSGASGEESAFMDASENGNDVFFLTASRLTAKDEDRALDLYDARVNGGEAAPLKPVECSGDACQQPAVPPNFETPGTSLIEGPENEHPAPKSRCARGKVKRRGKCVAKHHRRKKGSHRRANTNRRAGR